MLYLKSITLDKFKSFKHAELLLSKGFTCVVGPNGSGKSVIFDALSVALGEPSPSKLRVSALGQLINNQVRPKAGDFAKAHIKLEFDGDEKVTVTKVVRSDSKTLYKLNGKTMSRREVIEFFSSKAVRVDDTTTIAQGEIDGISKLNSKQRRELIDVAAGIKEFEYKKNEALKELEKVDQKISEANVMLREREGFLTELEKEKEAAESYLKMSQRVKHLRYSVLVKKHADLQSSFDESTKEIATIDAKKNDFIKRRTELSTKRDQLTQELQQLQSDFNKMNSTSGETRAKLEALNNELSKLDVEIPSLVKSIDDLNYFIQQSNAELKEAKDKQKQNSALVTDLNKAITKLDAEIAKAGEIPEGVDFGTEIEGLEGLITNDENHLVDIQNYISKLQADTLIVQSKKSEAEKVIEELTSKKNELTKAKEARAKLLSDMKARAKSTEAKIGELDEQCANLNRAIDQSDTELLNLKQQKWTNSQSRDATIVAKISEKFNQSDGFYGKAANLCTYESKYATAVETAASSRFEYFVVDSIRTASVIIEYLKKNNLGRATFIPISDLNSERVDTAKNEDIKPVISLAKYDAKFAKVFAYIFSNTYLINNPNDVKKFGVGKHRYVTLEGELIEQSGVISGGSVKGRMSLAAIENRIKSVTDENEKLKNAYHSATTSMSNESKEYALINMQLQTLSTETGESSNLLLDTERKLATLNDSITAYVKETKTIAKEIEDKDSEKLDIISSLNKNKDKRKAMHEKFMTATKGAADSKKLKAEKERVDGIRAESEANKIKKAELQKETQLLEVRCDTITKTVEDKQKQIKSERESLKDKDVRKEVLKKSKGDIEKEINSKSESGKKAYTRIQSINDDVGKLSTEYGKLDAEINGLERQTNEIKLRRGTSETRLSDITAELKAYDATIAPLKGKLEEMEAEVNVLNVKISDLGNVNLKAPEIYEERKRTVEEASSRVSTLQTEKMAVLSMIDEIDSKKLQTFMDMLNETNKNFMKLYNYVFTGKASLVIENEKDPLSSGIHIKITEGKTEKQFMSMSGGERAIISLMLLFSIHMGKKSSLYIFDEVDAALDKENAKKLSLLVKEMSKEAQFIVISHNDSLIVNADAAIGVVKTEGESKAYGVDVASIIKK